MADMYVPETKKGYTVIEVVCVFENKTQKDYLLQNQTFLRTGCKTGQSGITSASETRRDDA